MGIVQALPKSSQTSLFFMSYIFVWTFLLFPLFIVGSNISYARWAVQATNKNKLIYAYTPVYLPITHMCLHIPASKLATFTPRSFTHTHTLKQPLLPLVESHWNPKPRWHVTGNDITIHCTTWHDFTTRSNTVWAQVRTTVHTV